MPNDDLDRLVLDGGVVYAYDAAMSETRTDAYSYNTRNELTSATKLGGPQSPAVEYAYQYDDIGNRITSTDLTTNRTYTANSLNQYSAIMTSDSGLQTSSFTPQYDDDGNQTLIQTSTGVWSVQYNGENRPVLWTGGTQLATTNIVMSFDRMGRRVEYLETAGGSQSSATETNAYHRFVYDNYLCIQRLDAANSNTVGLTFVWDVTEPLATRPLVFFQTNAPRLYFTHDGNKNVSELVFFSDSSGMAAHYEYAPFGAVTVSTRDTSVTDYDFRTYNPFRFSSEYADDTISLIYYNHRHFDLWFGRWMSIDSLGNRLTSLYRLGQNSPLNGYDILGNDWGDNPIVCPLFIYNGQKLSGIVPETLDALPSIYRQYIDAYEDYSYEAKKTISKVKQTIVEVKNNIFTSCCNGKEYDRRTHCCENGNVVEKVSIWVGSRPLDNRWSKNRDICFIPHTYYLRYDPSDPNFGLGITNPEYGKEPISPWWWREPFSMLFSMGQVKGKSHWNCDNEVLQHDASRAHERKVCPSEKERLCSDHTTILPYVFLPPFNCWSYTWGISL